MTPYIIAAVLGLATWGLLMVSAYRLGCRQGRRAGRSEGEERGYWRARCDAEGDWPAGTPAHIKEGDES